MDHGGFDSAWNDVHRPQVREHVPPQFQDFDNIYNQGVGSQQQPIMDGNVEVHCFEIFMVAFFVSLCNSFDVN